MMYDKILELVKIYDKMRSLSGDEKRVAVHAAVRTWLDSPECTWDDQIPEFLIDNAIEFIYQNIVKRSRSKCWAKLF